MSTPPRVAALSVTFERLHQRYARLFWTLHSVWALFTGAVVLVLAHNRYGFLPWVILFLALTWATTLFFSRLARPDASRAMRLAHGFVSYLTRIMYQETLFFLIPFYLYSTTFPSWNSAYVIVLAALAILSCFDLVFDRLLREHRAFTLAFFALVTFSALQFFLPVLLKLRVHHGSYLAAAVSLLAAMPLAFSWQELRKPRRLVAVLIGLVLAIQATRLLRPFVPPVPLRLTKLRFASAFEPRGLKVVEEVEGSVSRAALAGGKLYAVGTVFAPTALPTTVRIRFLVDGRELRSSRTLELVAHQRGFRVWDALRAPPGGFRAGRYRVEVRTGEGQLIGRGALAVTD